jgi:hypothetical protein
MNIASLADVKRVGHFTDDNPTRDAALRAALAARQSWADTKMWKLTASGPQVETYWNVFEDATLQLPAVDVVVTKVKVYDNPSATGVQLSPITLGQGGGYDISDSGTLQLRPSMFVTPFEGAVATRRLRLFNRVEVFYLGTGVVPQAVTDGIAMLAAGDYVSGGTIFGGIKSEKIGDYSYTLNGPADNASGQPEYVERAMAMLRPFIKRSRVMVT